ncbi:MAG: DUF2231 domain-containing protein [Phycisphaerae bacterium]
MIQLSPPPLPPWEGLHPLVVHFPIALLLTVPLFVLLGLLPRVGAGIRIAALVLMVVGTVAAYVAVETGEAAGRLADRSDAVERVLEQHEELAETTRTAVTVLTAVYAAGLALPFVLRRTVRRGKVLPPAVPIIATVLFVAFWIGACLLLANTGHLGGRLVHELGVRALQ